MREHYELGPVPCDEECAQVGQDGFQERSTKEMTKCKEMLEKRFPQYSDFRCIFAIKWFPHDFGQYGEVCICYDAEDAQAESFMVFVESNLPQKWTNKEVLKTEIKPVVKCSCCGDIVKPEEVDEAGVCECCV